MILTDGVLDDNAEAFKAAKTKHSIDFNVDDVRIFTYLIGKDLKNAAPLKTIACDHYGYFSHIATTADVKENVMKYFHVMNRQLLPKNNFENQVPQWSTMYGGTMIGGKTTQEKFEYNFDIIHIIIKDHKKYIDKL